MSVKIENRTRVQKRLGKFVTTMAISKQLVDAIVNSPVGHVFLAAVGDLHDKLQFVAKLPPNTPSLGDVSGDLNSLRITVDTCYPHTRFPSSFHRTYVFIFVLHGFLSRGFHFFLVRRSS